MSLPRSQTGVGACTPSGSINLGSAFPIQFDGRAAFSLGAWIQVSAAAPTATLLQVVDACTWRVDAGTISFRFASQNSPLVGQFPLDDGWHYIVIVYDQTQPYAGSLTMYYDGIVAGQAMVSGLSPAPFVNVLTVGGDAAMNVWCVDIYARALPATESGCDWTPDDPDRDQLVAAFCFMRNPPMDAGPNDYPIVFTGAAAEQIVTPGVQLTANASALPLQDEGVSPGGDAAPYTLQAWVYGTDNGDAQLVICNGNLDESAFALGVAPAAASNALTIIAVRGGQNFTAGTFPLNEWHNIAASYDGATLSLFLDGVLVGATPSGKMSSPAPATLAIGAAYTSGGGLTAWFHGWIQSIDVWNQALSADDISFFQDVVPYGYPTCVAIYDFSGEAANGVTGSLVTLLNGAALGQFFVAPPSDYATQSARVAASRSRMQASAQAAAPTQTPARPAPLDDARAARLIETFDQALHPAVDAATREAARRIFADGVRQAQAWLREQGRPLPGAITWTRQGDEVVFWYHTAQGATVCYRMPAATNECATWWISLISTIVAGFLGLLGIPLAPGRVVAAVSRLLGDGQVGRAVASVLAEEVSTRTVVQALRVIFNFLALSEFLSDIFANLRWYEILFIVGAISLQLLEIMFPNPSTAALVALKLAQLGSVVVQVVLIIDERPPDCA